MFHRTRGLCLNYQSGIFDVVGRLLAAANWNKHWFVHKAKNP